MNRASIYKISAVVAMTFVSLLTVGGTAWALSNTSPSKGDMVYGVSVDSSVNYQARSMTIGAYYTVPPNTAKGNLSGETIRLTGGSNWRCDSGSFIISIEVVGGGSVNHYSNCSNLYRTYSVPNSSNVPIEASTGKIKVKVTIRTNDGEAYFRVTANNSSAKVGFISGSEITSRGDKYIDEEYGNSRNSRAGQVDHEFEFGSDCTIGPNTIKNIILRDPDNKTNLTSWGNSSPYTVTQGNPMLEVRLIDETTGMALSAEKVVNADKYSNGWYRPNGTMDSNYNSPDTVLSYKFQPNHKYKFVVWGVKWKNFLEVLFPFDSIYHDVTCANYTLTPETTTSSSVVMLNDTIKDVKSTITNSNTTTPSTQMSKYTFGRYVIPRGAGYIPNNNGGEISLGSNDSYFCNLVKKIVGNSITQCAPSTSADNGNSKTGKIPSYNNQTGQRFNSGVTTIANNLGDGVQSLDVLVGDKVCYMTVVNQYQQNKTSPTDWRYSKSVCVIVAKTPWVQIWGGDVRVGSAIGTNSGAIGGNNSAKISTLSTIQENLYGSWGEYGMVAPTEGIISSASAGAFSGMTGGAIDVDSSILSFANIESPPGKWATYATAKIPNFGTATQTLPASTSSINVGSYPAGTTNIVRVQGSNILNLSGTLQAGTTLIVNTSRTVTITGNITYARQTIGSAREASQLVVAAQNINIAEAVTEVNGWLIATPTSSTAQGVVSTCGSPASPYYTGLRSTNCDKKLTINGAITARQLQLRRTAGAEKDNLAAPAEVINQRADIFLWASSFATRSGLEMETAATMEAAPRF